MPNKELRFLIADGQHFYRLKIERALNQLGYYRIAPMNHLMEVLSVVDAGCEPIDLLVINASVATSAEFDLLSFCKHNPQIRYTLIYGCKNTGTQALSRFNHKTVQVTALSLPDVATLRALMAVVDPQDSTAKTRIEANHRKHANDF